MMLFRTVKDAIIALLGANEAGQFQTVGFQRQAKGAQETKGVKRFCQVFYDNGDFSKSSGRRTGPTQHDTTYSVQLTVSESALVDLNTINNPVSTPTQITTALAALQEASKLADDSIDDLFDILYQILMDGRNDEFGLGPGVVADRWISGFQKNEPVPRGQLVILTATFRITCRVAEQVGGDSSAQIDPIFDGQIDLDGDDVEKTGVSVGA